MRGQIEHLPDCFIRHEEAGRILYLNEEHKSTRTRKLFYWTVFMGGRFVIDRRPMSGPVAFRLIGKLIQDAADAEDRSGPVHARIYAARRKRETLLGDLVALVTIPPPNPSDGA